MHQQKNLDVGPRGDVLDLCKIIHGQVKNFARNPTGRLRGSPHEYPTRTTKFPCKISRRAETKKKYMEMFILQIAILPKFLCKFIRTSPTQLLRSAPQDLASPTSSRKTFVARIARGSRHKFVLRKSSESHGNSL